MSIRGTSRITGTAINSVAKLLVDAGHICYDYQYEHLRNLPCTRFEVDEVWSFVYAKEKNVAGAKAAPEHAGDVWTWTAICADTKLIPAWQIGDRSSDTAIPFMLTLRMSMRRFTRLTNAFSKKLANHHAMVALFMMYYNYSRKHAVLKTTPAVAAGATDRMWTVEDIVKLIDERTPQPGPRGPYKKRTASSK